jgi:hypothetical protein
VPLQYAESAVCLMRSLTAANAITIEGTSDSPANRQTWRTYAPEAHRILTALHKVSRRQSPSVTAAGGMDSLSDLTKYMTIEVWRTRAPEAHTILTALHKVRHNHGHGGGLIPFASYLDILHERHDDRGVAHLRRRGPPPHPHQPAQGRSQSRIRAQK